MVEAGHVPEVAMRSVSSREPLGWHDTAGQVMGVYLHGLFEHPAALQSLFGSQAPTLDRVFDHLADHVAACFAPGWLNALTQPRTPHDLHTPNA
jgi:adenosylcobyric acid synthase